jgi:hypothetical protein
VRYSAFFKGFPFFIGVFMDIANDPFYRKIWITKSCRFNSVKRLETYSKALSFLFLVITVALLGISIIIIIPSVNLTNDNKTLLGIGQVLISIFIFILSQVSNSDKTVMLAKEYNECALEIGKIYDKLKLLLHFADEYSQVKEEYAKIISEYDSTLMQYKNNHSLFDFYLVEIDQQKSWLKRTYIRIGFYFMSILCYFFSITVLVGLVYIFFYAFR